MKILTEFFSDWRTVGAVAPTSRFTMDKLLRPIDWQRARVVIELGPGTGNVTRAILARLHPDAHLLAIEIKERFAEKLRAEMQDPRLEVVHGSATDLQMILDERHLPQADAIISTLPFTSIVPPLRTAIIDAASKCLAWGGRLTALQYTPFVLPTLLQRHFGGFRVRASLLNIPPGLIYTCTRSSSPGLV